MKVWSIQTKEVLNQLKENGVHQIIDFSQTGWGEDNEVIEIAYEWLCEEMKERIGLPQHEKQLPIWCWHSWNGVGKKPDMRYKAHAKKGTEIFRLTLEIEENRLLLSDFDK